MAEDTRNRWGPFLPLDSVHRVEIEWDEGFMIPEALAHLVGQPMPDHPEVIDSTAVDVTDQRALPEGEDG